MNWWHTSTPVATSQNYPDRLIDQLIGLRCASMTVLGLVPDDLQTRATEFLAARTRDAHQRLLRTMAPLPRDLGPRPVIPTPRPDSVAWAWFPSSEYDRALRPHVEYCRALHGKLVDRRAGLNPGAAGAEGQPSEFSDVGGVPGVGHCGQVDAQVFLSPQACSRPAGWFGFWSLYTDDFSPISGWAPGSPS